MNNKGYTIIELLISTAILSFLIMGMVIMLLQQQRQFNFTKEISDIDTTGRTLLNFIASEIRNSGARQGKAFSLKFINGGSLPSADGDPACTNLLANNGRPTQNDIPNNDTGTIDSPPDCITIFTWDLTAGMTTISDAGGPELNIPSTTESSLIFTNNTNTLLIDLPESWVDDNGNFIDDNRNDGDDILLGFRSRQAKCNPNILIQNQCNINPELCSECAIIFNAILNESDRTANL